MDERREGNPLMSLPRPVVEALMENAQREAERAKARISSIEFKLKALGPLKALGLGHAKDGKVLVVDGSRSMGASQRIGNDYVIYTAGYKLFDGKELVKEEYYAGSVSELGFLDSLHVLSRLAMAYAERRLALEAYKDHKPDVILLDGPFFYFRSRCRYVHDVPLNTDIPNVRNGLDLITQICEMTIALMRSGRALCVNKRSRMRAIDGWLLCGRGEGARIGASDKHILTRLMRPMTAWAYASLFREDPYIYSAVNRFYQLRRFKGERPSPKDLIASAVKDLEKKFLEDLGLAPEDVPRTERHYIRYSASAPPFEVEVVEGTDVLGLAGYFADFYNPATGLPFPLDLIDQSVALPLRSTSAFAEEVEARLLKDKSIADKSAISDYFAFLNPQKKDVA